MTLGVIWMLTAQLITAQPAVAPWLTSLILGPIVGLAATGGYAAVKSASKPAELGLTEMGMGMGQHSREGGGCWPTGLLREGLCLVVVLIIC